jgi:hypothetical protein
MHKVVNGEIIQLTTEEEQAILDRRSMANAKREALKYQEDRLLAYPDIGEQLDMLFHAMDTGKLPKDNEFYDAIKAVKDQFPKPE